MVCCPLDLNPKKQALIIFGCWFRAAPEVAAWEVVPVNLDFFFFWGGDWFVAGMKSHISQEESRWSESRHDQKSRIDTRARRGSSGDSQRSKNMGSRSTHTRSIKNCNQRLMVDIYYCELEMKQVRWVTVWSEPVWVRLDIHVIRSSILDLGRPLSFFLISCRYWARVDSSSRMRAYDVLIMILSYACETSYCVQSLKWKGPGSRSPAKFILFMTSSWSQINWDRVRSQPMKSFSSSVYINSAYQ